jgi:hypothetical protein
VPERKEWFRTTDGGSLQEYSLSRTPRPARRPPPSSLPSPPPFTNHCSGYIGTLSPFRVATPRPARLPRCRRLWLLALALPPLRPHAALQLFRCRLLGGCRTKPHGLRFLSHSSTAAKKALPTMTAAVAATISGASCPRVHAVAPPRTSGARTPVLPLGSPRCGLSGALHSARVNNRRGCSSSWTPRSFRG